MPTSRIEVLSPICPKAAAWKCRAWLIRRDSSLLCRRPAAAVCRLKPDKHQRSGNGRRGIVEKINKNLSVDSAGPTHRRRLTIDETRKMVDEIFKAEKEYLKGYK